MRADHVLAAVITTAAALAIAASEAEACGPYFPTELLTDRPATLLSLEDGVFTDEVAKLVEPPDRSWPVVASEPAGARARGGARERALYERGAERFNSADHEGAIESFEALLALPAAERQHRSTWAAYMLGRIRNRIEDYQRVRALARAGFADELGLAVASLGQEARLHLHGGRLTEAVALYAKQAASGDFTGANSLLFVAREVIAERREARLVSDPIGERLLIAYLYTRSGELDSEQRERLWSFLGESESASDQLAAAAYRAGRFDLARRLAGRAPSSPRSIRVLAKLALRDGDDQRAELLLATLSGADCKPRVTGERAAIALYQGRHLEAMHHAWTVNGHYPDAEYIAERVLTIGELLGFVAAETWRTIASGADESRRALAILGELAGRRLMRAGQLERALPYFSEHRAEAAEYVAAHAAANAATDRIDRAAALYRASAIARRHGLEILGTRYGPDWQMFGARFDLSAYRGDDRSRWTSENERARVAASGPTYPHRYHYRYLAADLAEAAASALPRRSQAYAATLCHATRYVFHIDAGRRDELYARYVTNGPTVDFAATFGQQCPEPAFEAARQYVPRPEDPPWGAMLLTLLGALVGWFAYSAHRRLR